MHITYCIRGSDLSMQRFIREMPAVVETATDENPPRGAVHLALAGISTSKQLSRHWLC